jgi:hypothetical protein
MVARITTPGSVQKTLNYNEKKVQQGTAVCIGESGFILPLHKMNFYDKLERFENRNKLNERATTKTLHVSLNFSNSEQYDDAFLLQIATEYMTRIGFGEQPFLVYNHHDAGHPHIHILSTTIREDGTRINTHNIGRNQSEIARRFLEEKYGLVKAQSQSKETTQKVAPFNPSRLEYGKVETKRGIANVLHGILGSYNYTSLPELNAILKQYNVFADRCEEGGFIYSKRGLYYRVLDANGMPVGVPIKASSIAGNPTLANLEKRFEKNQKLREPLRDILKQKIDTAISKNPASIAELSALLLKMEVRVMERKNADGRTFGITFVDNQNRSVFNGSDIGRQYSIGGLLKQLNTPSKSSPGTFQTNIRPQQINLPGFIEFNGVSPLADLIKPEIEFNPTPYQLKRKKRKRKQ